MSSKYKFPQVARLCPVRNNIPILAIILVLPIQPQPNQPQAHSAGGPNHPVLPAHESQHQPLPQQYPLLGATSPGSPQPPLSPYPMTDCDRVTPAPASWICQPLARCKLKETSLSPSTIRTCSTSTKGTPSHSSSDVFKKPQYPEAPAHTHSFFS